MLSPRLLLHCVLFVSFGFIYSSCGAFSRAPMKSSQRRSMLLSRLGAQKAPPRNVKLHSRRHWRWSLPKTLFGLQKCDLQTNPPQEPYDLGDYRYIAINNPDGSLHKKLTPGFGTTSSYLDYLDHLSGKNYKYLKRRSVLDDNPSRLWNRLVSKEMRDDVTRRRKYYISDWTDGFANLRQVIPAILFLYFACLSPAVSFGTIASQLTNGSIGIVEFLLSCGISGSVYAVLCGQPMAFIAPTGLTLAFISGLYRFCSLKNLPFFPIYAWVGIWTSSSMILLGLGGASQLIRFCTRFTDEIFNSLLSLNFIYEALASMGRLFKQADPINLTMPFVSLTMALTTYLSTMKVTLFQNSRYLNQKARTFVKDFGPLTIFVFVSMFNQHPWLKKFAVPTLTLPNSFELAGGRPFLVALNEVPLRIRLLCSFPAFLLTCLFFMDQNISVRVVNNPENQLKKGPAYSVDMVALGLITGALSFFGLPWMCGATVQSVNHVRALTETKYNNETGGVDIVSVTETRLTGFCVHALIASTLGLLPLLRFVPTPVVAGTFLFLGRKLMTGNSFLQRVRDSTAEQSRLPVDHPIQMIGRRKVNLFTAIQIACLVGLWTFKQNPATAIFFPSVIVMLMLIRTFALPKIFTEEELVALGDATPA